MFIKTEQPRTRDNKIFKYRGSNLITDLTLNHPLFLKTYIILVRMNMAIKMNRAVVIPRITKQKIRDPDKGLDSDGLVPVVVVLDLDVVVDEG